MWLLGFACAGKGKLPTQGIIVGEESITVEVADEPEERHNGLMFRKKLPTDSGMLFVYPEPQSLSFWMKNTHIPLSIAYLDETGRILNIEDMSPHNTQTVTSAAPAMYALEMNQGWFADNGIERGQVVTGLTPAAEQ